MYELDAAINCAKNKLTVVRNKLNILDALVIDLDNLPDDEKSELLLKEQEKILSKIISLLKKESKIMTRLEYLLNVKIDQNIQIINYNNRSK